MWDLPGPGLERVSPALAGRFLTTAQPGKSLSIHFLKTSDLVNYCVAILILMMEDKYQHFQHIMFYYFKKGKNTTERQKKICAVYGEGAVTDRTCQKWFAKFRAGDFSLDDVPRSGGPVEVESDQIETLI